MESLSLWYYCLAPSKVILSKQTGWVGNNSQRNTHGLFRLHKNLHLRFPLQRQWKEASKEKSEDLECKLMLKTITIDLSPEVLMLQVQVNQNYTSVKAQQ